MSGIVTSDDALRSLTSVVNLFDVRQNSFVGKLSCPDSQKERTRTCFLRNRWVELRSKQKLEGCVLSIVLSVCL